MSMTNAVTPYKFSTTIKVRYADTDMQRHVFFGNYFTYFDEALMEYLEVLGFGYPVIIPQALDWVYADAHASYKGAALLADKLAVHAQIARIGNSSVTAAFQIFNQSNAELITTGELTFVVVDATTLQPTRVPEFFRDAVAQYQGEQAQE